jgi:hypothetical protein
VLEHGFFVRLAAELGCELDDRVPVRDGARDVRPLPRVGALREQPAEVGQRFRMSDQDTVRVVVDQADPS